MSCATRAVEWVKKLPGIQEVDFLGPEHMVVVDFDPKEVNGKGIAAMILMSLEYSPIYASLPPYTIEYVKD